MDKKEDKVVNFIERRLVGFTSREGNSYWCARILSDRFPSLKVFYLPDSKRFVAGDEDKGIFYDMGGRTDVDEQPCSFDKLLHEDPKKYFDLLKIYRD